MLNELDEELEARGLRFTIYADDCVMVVRSEEGHVNNNGLGPEETRVKFLRMNTACPRERLLDGLERLKRGVKAYGDYVAESCC